MHRDQAVPLFFPPKVRKQVEDLACKPPASVGLKVLHWSTRSLEQAVSQLGMTRRMDHSTIHDILRAANLQVHRYRYWKTTIWDERAIARAIKILWYYERVRRLWQRGEVVIALDEKPNIQVLERAAASPRMQAGRIERQEFEYRRHGTVNLLVGLTLYNGRMWAECLDKNDGEHFRPAVRRLLHPYGWARRIHLVMDNGSSHTSGDTEAFFKQLRPRVHVLFTPSHASWLNQAELLLRAFTGRYLDRGSWETKGAMIAHLLASRVEYNRCYSHPFKWEWTCRDFRYWLNNNPSLIRCRT
jgi:transposase